MNSFDISTIDRLHTFIENDELYKTLLDKNSFYNFINTLKSNNISSERINLTISNHIIISLFLDNFDNDLYIEHLNDIDNYIFYMFQTISRIYYGDYDNFINRCQASIMEVVDKLVSFILEHPKSIKQCDTLFGSLLIIKSLLDIDKLQKIIENILDTFYEKDLTIHYNSTILSELINSNRVKAKYLLYSGHIDKDFDNENDILNKIKGLIVEKYNKSEKDRFKIIKLLKKSSIQLDRDMER